MTRSGICLRESITLPALDSRKQTVHLLPTPLLKRCVCMCSCARACARTSAHAWRPEEVQVSFPVSLSSLGTRALTEGSPSQPSVLPHSKGATGAQPASPSLLTWVSEALPPTPTERLSRWSHTLPPLRSAHKWGNTTHFRHCLASLRVEPSANCFMLKSVPPADPSLQSPWGKRTRPDVWCLGWGQQPGASCPVLCHGSWRTTNLS